MNEATKLGIEATNNARQAGVSAVAQQKIGFILEERRKIEDYKKAKASVQESLNKLALDLVTYEQVTGSELPETPNANQATIIKAIEGRNASNQINIKAQSESYVNSITSYDKSIKATEDRIKVLVDELNKLSVDVVTEAQVVG